ncbi:MAG: molybdopterin molybdotransferase MoeA [Bryobacteraceae bacterium]|nr:molybdopterin molybdotransferase MoeA [Bryobacteraceae bacterium]
MGYVQPLTFATARETVLRIASGSASLPLIETLPLDQCSGRVLASDIRADRAYPSFARSVRDGFALSSTGFQGLARIVGEVKAGQHFHRALGQGEAVAIMTGAPVPEGADAVIMVEHTRVEHTSVADATMTTDRAIQSRDNIVFPGTECATGAVVVPRGTRLDYAHVATLATVGATQVPVYRRPSIAVLATGDELVPADTEPAPYQIRNSNAPMLATQIRRAGACPVVLPVARDEYEPTRSLIEQGLQSDMLLLSGGVSAGKYDLVETVLSDLGAEFFFDRVLIQPGQPLVFGRVRDRLVFGLPGNPVSSAVTFELFARIAIDAWSGASQLTPGFLRAPLAAPFRHRMGLTRFLPAVLQDGIVTHKSWQGSGDVFAVASANAFLVAREDRESWDTGDLIEVLPR